MITIATAIVWYLAMAASTLLALFAALAFVRLCLTCYEAWTLSRANPKRAIWLWPDLHNSGRSYNQYAVERRNLKNRSR